MSVSNGQQANADTFNNAFVSKTVNSTVVSLLDLNNASSGGQIANAQQAINDNTTSSSNNAAQIATNTADIATNAADIAALQASVPFNNFSAVLDPTAANDNTESYLIGSQWINTTNNRIFQCVDNSTGAAIWKRIDKVSTKQGFTASIDFSSNNLTDAAYVELVADTGSDVIRNIEEFYPAGSIAILAVGPAASEVDQFFIFPGGDGTSGYNVEIAANSRISLILLSGQSPVTSGVAAFNFSVEA